MTASPTDYEQRWCADLAERTGLAWRVRLAERGSRVLVTGWRDSDERGLGFEATVERWHSGEHVIMICAGETRPRRFPVEVGARGWREEVTPALASYTLACAALWAARVAALFEAAAPAASLTALVGRDCRYDRRGCPPGWTVEPFDVERTAGWHLGHPPDRAAPLTVARLGGSWVSWPPEGLAIAREEAAARLATADPDTYTVRHAWRGDPDAVRAALWARHEVAVDPPGYAFELHPGLDHGRRLWTWRWAGRDVTTSACPKDRASARADAWADFWAEMRSAESAAG